MRAEVKRCTWLLLLSGLVFGVGRLAAMSPESGAVAGAFYGVVLNGVPQTGFALLVLDADARPYMAQEDFVRLGLARAIAPVMRDGVALVPLQGHPGMVVFRDAQQLSLRLEVEPDWFAPTRMNLHAPQAGRPLPASPGALLNYTLQATRSEGHAMAWGGTQSLSLFGSLGLLQLNTAIQSGDGGAASWSRQSSARVSRLATTFLHDDEQHLSTWSVGDAVLQSTAGVPSLRYGGVTWQSNFGLDPAFSALESPTLFDSARLPSTLEFFLNDRRVGAPVAVAAGPFEVSGLPTVGVNGTVNVLIRDALLNERTVTVPFLNTTSLYRQGLRSFSYTVGWLRPELNTYQTPFLSTSHRWGATRRVTLDAGATLSTDQRSAGLGASAALWGPLLGHAHATWSQALSGAGQQWGASLQWQDTRTRMGASFSRASPHFRLLADRVDSPFQVRDEFRFFAAQALGQAWGSVSVSAGGLSDGQGGTRRMGSVGWSKSLGLANVSLSAVRSTDQTILQVLLSAPLERGAFMSGSVQKMAHALTGRVDYASAPVTSKGMAWRLGLLAKDPTITHERTGFVGAVDVYSGVGQHGVDVASSAAGQTWRVRTAGSAGGLGGHYFVGPPITGGFALVSTGDAPQIPVYRWNLPVAVSDARGVALVTALSPYQKNLLAIKPEEVPLQYRVASHEVTAIPRGRGGVWVDFSVLRERSAVLVLTGPDGQVLPAGSRVHVSPGAMSAAVGLRGEVYVQNLPARAQLQVDAQVLGLTQHCLIEVDAPITDDPQPRLGPYVCALRPGP